MQLPLYERFVRAREAAIISEIRNACGVKLAAAAVEEDDSDDLAADVKDGTAPLLEPLEELAFDLA